MENEKEIVSESKAEREEGRIRFPNAEAAIIEYLKEYGDDPEKHGAERAELLREVFDEFLNEELENTKLFRSKEGVELPYTSISTEKLARRIYERTSGDMVTEELEDTDEQAPRKQLFMFGTSPSTAEGDQFTFVETAMHECMKYLPSALEDLEEGKRPEAREIFTLGLPTSPYGEIPEAFAERMKQAPFDALGDVYAELVELEMKRDSTMPPSVELYGMSLGGNLAVRTGVA